MKKMIMAISFIALTIGNMAFAGEKEIDKRVKQNFEKEFAGAVDVKWYSLDDYVQVDFTFRDMRLMGYYSQDGETLGLARHITFSSLPLQLQLDVKKSYKDYWITQIYELDNKEGTRYFITIENADKSIKLGSIGSTGWGFVTSAIKK